MSYHAWFEHFKEQLQGLTESFEQSGSQQSLLGYALQARRLDSEVYLKWAQSHFKLPKLQSRFFTETPVSQEMFAKWATHYPWSQECLPVAEWDGSLIVACLQPPQDFPSTPQCIFVLAEYEGLHETWNKLHPQASPVEAKTNPVIEVPAEDVPDGIDLSIVTITKHAPPPADSFSIDDLSVADAPAPAKLEALSLNEAAVPPVEEGLDGLIAGPTKIHLEALPGDAVVNENTSNEAVAEVEVATPTPVTQEKKIPPPPPPVGAKTTTPPPFEDSFGNKPTPIVPRPTGVAKPTLNPVSVANFTLEKMKKRNQTLLNDRIKQTLSEMKTHFEKSLILTLDDQESQLMVFAWDENFSGMTDTSLRIPLNTPSIFSIVASTQKPFHGYISLNDINEKFFEVWNKGSVPDHVTITPLIINEKLVGMLMGFADKTAYNRVALNHAERLSQGFVKGLQAA